MLRTGSRDQIIGYLNAGHGLDIHTEDCVNLSKFRKTPEKCLPVTWSEDVQGYFRVGVNVEMLHQRGALAALTKSISSANANIDDIQMSERSGGYCLVSLHLLVRNLSHLERVMRHISNVPVVIGVIRRKGN